MKRQICPAGNTENEKRQRFKKNNRARTYAFVNAVQEVVQLLNAVLVGSVLNALGALLEVVLQWGAGRGLTTSYSKKRWERSIEMLVVEREKSNDAYCCGMLDI
jgi:hypothetical protein